MKTQIKRCSGCLDIFRMSEVVSDRDKARLKASITCPECRHMVQRSSRGYFATVSMTAQEKEDSLEQLGWQRADHENSDSLKEEVSHVEQICEMLGISEAEGMPGWGWMVFESDAKVRRLWQEKPWIREMANNGMPV